MNQHPEWIEKLAGFETLPELLRSDFFASAGEEISSFLRTPQIQVLEGAAPRLESFLRIAQWNIEKGKRFDRILDLFRNDGILKWADIIILNEADCGMNRSQNRHVASELAGQLGMHMAYGPAHFELTRGTDDDLLVPGRNRESLQGNAVLSRYPILGAFLEPLPVTFEPYEFEEKRFGRRSCLWAQIELKNSLLWVGSVHLELRNTPRCRALQFRHIMNNLPGGDGASYLLGGDLNTNSFGRGTSWRTLQSVCRILLQAPAEVMDQLLHPETGREPLFEAAERWGFFWDTLNANEETARTAMNTLEESRRLPGFLRNAIEKRLRPYGGYLCFKLDWLLGKHLEALIDGQITDAASGTTSLNPGRIHGKNYGPDRISDHLPIYADIDLR